MKIKDVIVLKKIISYCEEARQALEMFHYDFEAFKYNSVFTNSCCMCMLQIGELYKTLSDEIKKEESYIQWKEWCGIRDIFAHQYFNIDYQSAWDTLNEDLPYLEAECKKILRKM